MQREYTNYALLLKAIRARTDETQQEFADRVHLRVGTVRGWEQGRYPRVAMHRAVIENERIEQDLPAVAPSPSPHPSPLTAGGGHSPTTQEI